MRIIKITLASILTSLIILPPAYASLYQPDPEEQEEKIENIIEIRPTFYGGIFGGLANASSFKTKNAQILNQNVVVPGSKATANFRQPAYLGGFDYGWHYTNFRYEFEFFLDFFEGRNLKYTYVDVNHTTRTETKHIKANMRTYGAFFNMFYDFSKFRDDVNFAPYIGAGIGFVHVQDKTNLSIIEPTFAVPGQQPPAFVLNPRKPNGNSEAYQFMIGMNFFINDETRLFIDYRAIAAGKMNVFLNRSLKVQSINVGVNTIASALPGLGL